MIYRRFSIDVLCLVQQSVVRGRGYHTYVRWMPQLSTFKILQSCQSGMSRRIPSITYKYAEVNVRWWTAPPLCVSLHEASGVVAVHHVKETRYRCRLLHASRVLLLRVYCLLTINVPMTKLRSPS